MIATSNGGSLMHGLEAWELDEWRVEGHPGTDSEDFSRGGHHTVVPEGQQSPGSERPYCSLK